MDLIGFWLNIALGGRNLADASIESQELFSCQLAILGSSLAEEDNINLFF